MADVYHVNSDLEISRQDVFENEDIAELQEWLEEQRDVAGELIAMLGALKLAPDADAGGVARKLGYVNISVKWITTRLKQLGLDAEAIGGAHEAGIRKQFRVLEEVVQNHKAKIKALNIENTELKKKVAALEKVAA